jgi:hypothetical protein
MVTGIEAMKSFEKIKTEPVNKPENIYGKIVGELQNPKRLEAELKKALQENPQLRDQYNKALESGNSVQTALVRGKIMEKVVENVSNSHFDNVKTQTTVFSDKGNKHITDLSFDAKERISFSGNRNDQVSGGDKVSVELKAGGQNYLERELKGHGKEQASAHEGKSVILVTKDFKDLPIHKQTEIRSINREQGTTIIAGLPRVSVIDECISKSLSSLK